MWSYSQSASLLGPFGGNVYFYSYRATREVPPLDSITRVFWPLMFIVTDKPSVNWPKRERSTRYWTLLPTSFRCVMAVAFIKSQYYVISGSEHNRGTHVPIVLIPAHNHEPGFLL